MYDALTEIKKKRGRGGRVFSPEKNELNSNPTTIKTLSLLFLFIGLLGTVAMALFN